MEIFNIMKDALRYPFSDMKKIFVLGLIFTVSGISGFSESLGAVNDVLIFFLGIIGLIIGLLGLGYIFRIIKLSLIEITTLPVFDDWFVMFIDGTKIFIVSFVYLIPAILVMLISAAYSFTSLFTLTFGDIGLNPLSVIGILLGDTIWPGIFNLIGILYNISLMGYNIPLIGEGLTVGLLALMAIFFTILVIPIMLMAMVNMAKSNGTLLSAFKFREVLNKIAEIGFLNFVVGYIVIGILFFIILITGILITYVISGLLHPIIGTALLSLIVISYLYMYLSRSIALFYISE